MPTRADSGTFLGWSDDPTDFVKVTSTPAFRYSCYVEGTSDYYRVGDIVTLKCTPINGYAFSGWYVNGTLVSTSDTYSFTASQNIEVTPSFGVCLITASANPTNGGTVNRRIFGLVYFLVRYVAPVGIVLVCVTSLLG